MKLFSYFLILIFACTSMAHAHEDFPAFRERMVDLGEKAASNAEANEFNFSQKILPVEEEVIAQMTKFSDPLPENEVSEFQNYAEFKDYLDQYPVGILTSANCRASLAKIRLSGDPQLPLSDRSETEKAARKILVAFCKKLGVTE